MVVVMHTVACAVRGVVLWPRDANLKKTAVAIIGAELFRFVWVIPSSGAHWMSLRRPAYREAGVMEEACGSTIVCRRLCLHLVGAVGCATCVRPFRGMAHGRGVAVR